MQRTLARSVLALESTALRLRRLNTPGAPQAPESPGKSRGAAQDARTSATASRAAAAPAASGSGGRAGSPAPQESAASCRGAPSGRVAHDARGNAVWKWAAEASALALESTSRLLKKLELPELAVDDKPQGLALEERDPGGGYDPYNRR